MAIKETCKACHGTGMLSDDEGWQYKCSVCHGDGIIQEGSEKTVRVMLTDDNNRLLD
ncbi:hypothetical protein ACFFIS_10955 [Virgibacillus soli]|uniref:Uncharacterized protein n=1 Tax=Paracerasibacillus soli TaxID=480284 RepID=A0ABU5CVQ1_9BACI|nr:hypothetical protein [Virgibacillus soli]MDY0410330.1 hypothetical protein [Virgibacillus soli]